MARSVTRLAGKRLLASLHDVGMAAAAMAIALLARYGADDLPGLEQVGFWVGVFALVSGVVFAFFGLGRGMWRFASLSDFRTIAAASTMAVLGFLVVVFIINRLEALPRTAPLIAWFVMIVLLGAPRLLYRAFKDGALTGVGPNRTDDRVREHVLIAGGVADADRVIRNYALETSRRYRVQGIVDLAEGKGGRVVRGVPVVGTIDDLDAVVERLRRGGIRIGAVVIASPRAAGPSMQKLAATAARLGLPLRRVSDAPLIGSEPDLANITLEDLLGRAPVQLNLDNIQAFIEGRVVLVTGAGGSIGSEIVRQVAQRRPAKLVLLDSSEFALYEVDLRTAREAPSITRAALIGDVRDAKRVGAVMREHKPAIVFHAAALKHVPLVEANIGEAILTNAIGTRNVADAAIAAGVAAVVVISTDKAIRPTSAMGMTKRVAEAYCQALDISGVATRFITVRFGNVLGSNGSVVPLFKRQIADGGPITITHPEMKRYFMTIREATELVLQAAANGVARDDQRGRIFVLDMGEPITIIELARTMIALSGLKPDEDIGIVYTGLRPGEKLFEELFDADEPTEPAGADGVFVASARLIERSVVTRHIADLSAAAAAGDEEGGRQALAATLAGMKAPLCLA
ncbi:MAG: polysaccharide biosynthesis protein [Microvirga sp.]|nr:polysaccharide biosynthesis protein [Microvirga sp.]